MSSPPFTSLPLRRLIVSEYDTASCVRGARYARDGRVDRISAERFENGWSIEAQVIGSSHQPYLVEILLLPKTDEILDLDQLCSCPLGGFCKHGVAVLELLCAQPDRWFREGTPHQKPRAELAAPELESEPEPGVIPWPGPIPTPKPPRKASLPSPPKPPAPTSLTPALSAWLARLADAGVERGNDRGPDPAPQVSTAPMELVVYILDIHQHRLRVVPALARRVKGGAPGSASQLPWSSLVGDTHPRGVTAEDRRLAREIAFEQSSLNAWIYFLTGETGGTLLRRLLDTGRCYWQRSGKHVTPLDLGPVRKAVPTWQVQPNDSQKPTLEVTPPATEVLPLVPLWYVDVGSSQCGPLETPLSPTAAIAWLDAPAVEVEQSELVVKALAPEAGRMNLPLPESVRVVWADGIEPKPVLTLHGAAVPQSRFTLWKHIDPRDAVLGLGRLSFRYGGAEIAFGFGGQDLRERTPEGIIRYRRNLTLEATHESFLRRCGLVPAPTSGHLREWGKHDRDYLPFDDSEWLSFMQDGVAKLRVAGWEVVVEPSFPWRLSQPESWFIDAESVERRESGPQEDWFGVELGVVVDGERINLLPILLRLLAHDPKAFSPERLAAHPEADGIPLTLPNGQKLVFPKERAQALQGVLLDLFEPGCLDDNGRLRVRRLRAVELAGESTWSWMGSTDLQALATRLRDFKGLVEVAKPAGLKANLRGYQQDGLNWLQFLRDHGLGGILADDMGLGKTVQTLAHLVVEKESGRADRPSLVVAPTSLMTNWRQEAERFAPGLRVLVLHGLDRKDHFDRIADHDLILTTYPLLPRDEKVLRLHAFHCLILDEAQFIKNPATAAAQAAAGLQARHRLCLTGTPMENHLGELWSLFDFLMPGFLGTSLKFRRLFRTPIEKLGDATRREILARRVKPFLLRRRKEEVARELPAKNEIVQNVELQGAQRDLYESVRLAMHKRVREEVKKKGFSRAHIVILDALLKLRQICCHPQLLDLPSAKAVTESAKLDLLFELVPSLLEEGRRILLFSQFTSMLALIEAELVRRKLPYVLLTGDTRDRATPVRRFQSGEVPLFLISLKAGGTGLNLTAADTVIHYDPWWNPAVENQATDRAHRIGQEKQVFVYRLLTLGTVEEKIAALQTRKRELVAGLLDTQAAEKLVLTHDDLESLFAPVEETAAKPTRRPSPGDAPSPSESPKTRKRKPTAD